MVYASLKDTRNCFHSREQVGLAKIVPTKKRLSMSYGLRLLLLPQHIWGI